MDYERLEGASHQELVRSAFAFQEREKARAQLLQEIRTDRDALYKKATKYVFIGAAVLFLFKRR